MSTICYRSLGYINNRLNDLQIAKESKRQSKKSRFDFGRKSQISTNPNDSLDLSLNSSRDRTANLLKNQEIVMDIEMTENKLKQNLPPEWVDQYESIQSKILDIRDLQKRVKEMNKERVKKITFGDTKDQDSKINNAMDLATRLLKECEKQTQNIDKIQSKNIEDPKTDQKIKQNVKRSLASQIQEIAAELRNEQKNMYKTMIKFSANDQNELNKFSNSNQKQQEFVLYEDEIGKIDEQDLELDLAQERDSEINKLVDQINELAQIFKHLNDVVIEQGTLLDRIDCNIESTQKQVKEANKHLKKAAKLQETSMCVKRVTFALICLIVIFAFILVWKWS